MRKIICVVAIIVLMGLLGCGEIEKSDNYIPVLPPTSKKVEAEIINSRFTIRSFGKFKAGYNDNEREILIITDTETKKEYLSITGCGTTEVVHKGKTIGEE